jgi:segregation and condensation protein A
MTISGPEERPSASDAPYAVKLPIFEGPLDLLLHLIRLNEVDVVDIPIAEIAQQYVDYLGFLQELNLDVAGEYLLMAATLAWIKSRMLLPPSEEDAEEEGVDPRAELIARLLEYQRFKEAAEQLGERSRLGRDVFAAALLAPEAPPEGEREIEVGLVQLLEAFRRVLQGAKAAGSRHEVEVETVTVRERMFAVMELLQQAESLELERLFELERGGPPSRAVLVATFLAILELVRVAALRVYQGVNENWVPEGPIRLRAAEAGAAWRERIADVT